MTLYTSWNVFTNNTDQGARLVKSLNEVKAQQLKTPAVYSEYEKLKPEYAIARELIAMRIRAGMPQAVTTPQTPRSHPQP